MVESFPRTLSLLRQERKTSQKEAAMTLGVSQALLSHYENGLREPGLEFVANAARFYGVTTDYLLGLSMERKGSVVSADELPDAAADKDNRLQGSAMALLQKKLVVNSISLIFDLLGKLGSKKFIEEAANYLSFAVYKLFRYVYLCGGRNPDAFFSIPAEAFSDLVDSEMKYGEMRLNCIAHGKMLPSLDEDKLRTLAPELTHDTLKRDYPNYSQSLLALLHNVGQKMEKRL